MDGADLIERKGLADTWVEDTGLQVLLPST
jgi:hypothetical protein